MTAISYRVNPPVNNAALNALFASAWAQHRDRDFEQQLRRSLAYVCAFSDGQLMGFVNLAWDGGIHAFLLDTTVHAGWQRRGVGRALVMQGIAAAHERGIVWMHVDYEPHLETFYRACGFMPTRAGLINLSASVT